MSQNVTNMHGLYGKYYLQFFCVGDLIPLTGTRDCTTAIFNQSQLTIYARFQAQAQRWGLLASNRNEKEKTYRGKKKLKLEWPEFGRPTSGFESY